MYRVEPINEEHARDILDWRYPAPYDFYNPPVDDNTEYYVSEFVRPEFQFHAVLDRNNELVGFCSYGQDGQVPGGDYTYPALDIGLGMKPEFTGQGMGAVFFTAILRHATRAFGADKIRLTVANFNIRAMSLYRKFGFYAASEFTDTRNQVDYTILLGEYEADAVLPKI